MRIRLNCSHGPECWPASRSHRAMHGNPRWIVSASLCASSCSIRNGPVKVDKPRKYSIDEFRSAFGKESDVAKCKICGRTIDPKFDICIDCRDRQRGGPAQPYAGQRSSGRLPQDYLKKGYFES